MKIPKPRKLPSGSWFIQLRLGGESVSVTEQTEKDCIASARLIKAEHLAGKREKADNSFTLRQAIDKYIDSRENILSPSTIRGYRKIRDLRFKGVMDLKISDIKNWQVICNEESKLCSAKTLKNSWFFIASVLKFAGLNPPRVNLPQMPVEERPYLEPEQIPAFLDAIKDSDCEVAALLALHSMRRSEICALTWNNVDLKNRRILVSGAVVVNSDNNLVSKKTNKNSQSHRYIPIFIERLYELLSRTAGTGGNVVTIAPHTIYNHINDICQAKGLPMVGVHGLRHSFASLAYHLGVPEKVAMQIGGWSDYNVMRKIYTHLAKKDLAKHELKFIDFFNNANDNANEI